MFHKYLIVYKYPKNKHKLRSKILITYLKIIMKKGNLYIKNIRAHFDLYII